MELTTLTSTFVTELDSFAYTLSSTDRVWNILFPDPQEKWHHLHINQYQQTYYITHISGDSGGLEIELGKDVKQTTRPTGNTTWEFLLTAARQWLKVIRKDWIKANKKSSLNTHYVIATASPPMPSSAPPSPMSTDSTKNWVKLTPQSWYNWSKPAFSTGRQTPQLPA